MRYCAALQQDFGKFKEDFDLVGTHLSRAHGKYADAEKRLDRFETKLDQAADEQVELETGAASARPRRRLEPQQRGEAADRLEVAVLLADHLDRPAVRQRLVDGEIEAGFGFLRASSRPAGSSHPRVARGRTRDRRTPAGRRRPARAAARRGRRTQPASVSSQPAAARPFRAASSRQRASSSSSSAGTPLVE